MGMHDRSSLPIAGNGFRQRCMVDILRKNLKARGMLGDGFVPESHLPKSDKPHRCCKVDPQQRILPAHPDVHDEIADDGVEAVVDYLRRSASADGSHADLESLANAARARMIQRAQAEIERSDGVFADEETVKLHDPQSSKRIENPGRGKNCKHVGCFDISTFIRMALQKTRQSARTECANPKRRAERKCHPLHQDLKPHGMCDYCKAWKCPECWQRLELHELEFEPFTKKILEETSPAIKKVKVTLSKGEWQAIGDEIKEEEEEEDGDEFRVVITAGTSNEQNLESSGAGVAGNPITLDSDSEDSEELENAGLNPSPSRAAVTPPAPMETEPAPQAEASAQPQLDPTAQDEPPAPQDDPTPQEEPPAPQEEVTAPAQGNQPASQEECSEITKEEVEILVSILQQLREAQQVEAFGILKTGYKADEVVPADLTKNKQENLIQLDAFVRKVASLPTRQEKRDLDEVVNEAYLERLGKQSREADDAAKDAVRKKKERDEAAKQKKEEAAKKKKEADELAKAEAEKAAAEKAAAEKAAAEKAAAQANAQKFKEQREKVIPARKHAPLPPSPSPEKDSPRTPPSPEPIGVFDEGLMANTVGKLTSLMDTLRDADKRSEFCLYASTDGKPENTMLKDLKTNFLNLYRMTVSMIRKHDRNFTGQYNKAAVKALHDHMRQSICEADLKNLRTQVGVLKAGALIQNFCKALRGDDESIPKEFFQGNVIQNELEELAKIARETRQWWTGMLKPDKPPFPELVGAWIVGLTLGVASPGPPTDPQRRRRRIALERAEAEKRQVGVDLAPVSNLRAAMDDPDSGFVDTMAGKLKKRKAVETPEQIEAERRRREEEARAQAEREARLAEKREKENVKWKQVWPEGDLLQCYACIRCYGVGICEWVNSKHQKVPRQCHPILRVPMCDPCYIHYHHEKFEVAWNEESGKMEHDTCRCCATEGDLVFCGNPEYKCAQAFCQDCILRMVGQEDLDEILECDPWVCFCCDPKPIEHLQVRWE